MTKLNGSRRLFALTLRAPEPPKTIEAVLLNYIDEIDSRVNAIREFMAADDPDASWTAYHRLLERQFYKGETKGSEE